MEVEKRIELRKNDMVTTEDFGSVSMEAVMDTVSRVYLGITLLGLTFAILQGLATDVRQIIDGLFTFIRGALWFIPGMGQTYFSE